MFYSVNQMANAIPLNKRTIGDMFFKLRLIPMFELKINGQAFYSLHQIDLIKLKLEKRPRPYKVEIDFENEEVHVILESKINNQDRNENNCP